MVPEWTWAWLPSDSPLSSHTGRPEDGGRPSRSHWPSEDLPAGEAAEGLGACVDVNFAARSPCPASSPSSPQRAHLCSAHVPTTAQLPAPTPGHRHGGQEAL